MMRFIQTSLAAALLASTTAAAPPSPAATQSEFQTICENIRNTENAFYGTAQVQRLEALLARPNLPPQQRVQAQGQLATHLLRLGKNEQAVALYNETLQLASRVGVSKNEAIGLLARLGLAALRMGEVKNCVGHHGPEMCLLPISADGQHRDPQGAELAIRAFEGVLAGSPDYPLVPWLLNIAAMTVGRYPEGVPMRYRVPSARMRSSYDIGKFENVAGTVGLHIMDVSGGAVMDDFTGDGALDIITSSAEPCTPLRFFENNGRGGFENRSVPSGLNAQLGGINLTHADYDNDGDLDLLILRGGWMGKEGRTRNSLMRNKGKGSDGKTTFEDVTHAAGLAAPYPTQVAVWADYDLDGHLDLFLGNEGETTEQAFASQLFRNRGDGTFEDMATSAGVRNFRYVKGAAWGDVDNDGDPDLYVSNFGPNRLFLNRGKGSNGQVTFEDVAPRLQMTQPQGQSFGSWFFDYDNDGWLDLFVASYEAGPDTIADYFLKGKASTAHPLLYHNEGGGRFREVSVEMGLGQPSAPMGHNFGDLDNDGYLDFYLGTGWPQYEALMPNLMYRNDRGRRFVDITYSGGFGHLQKGHGIAFGDIDNDGDQDVFEQMGGAFPGDAYPSSLYENPGHGNRFLVLELHGKRANRAALGARVRVDLQTPAGRRSLHRVVTAGGSFGGSSLRLEIGLGKARAIEEVEIMWPIAGAKPQRLGKLALDSWYRVREGESATRYERTPMRLGGGPGG